MATIIKKHITITITWYVLLATLGLFLMGTAISAIGGYMLYKRVLATEASQRRLVDLQGQERERREAEAAELLSAQQTEITHTKEALELAQQESAKTTAQVRTLSKTLEDQSRAEKEIVLSSTDLSTYITGVVQVICSSPSGISSGSGSLFTFKEVSRAILTNHHVVENADRCVVLMTSSANTTTGMFSLDDAVYTYNKNTDEAILAIGPSLSSANVPVANYNYSIASMRTCPSLMPVGTPVVIVGFPAYAKRDATIAVETIGTVHSIYRTVTNGIVSGYDTSKAGDANYFVSAKIDNGNSGGIALAKDRSGLCTLGLPTWLTVGNYETQGLVQNINNLLPKN